MSSWSNTDAHGSAHYEGIGNAAVQKAFNVN